MLFLQHVIAHMKSPEEGGGKAGIVLSASHYLQESLEKDVLILDVGFLKTILLIALLNFLQESFLEQASIHIYGYFQTKSLKNVKDWCNLLTLLI